MFRDPVKGDKVIHYGRKAVVTSVYINRMGFRICEIEYDDFTNGSPLYDEVLSQDLTIIDDEPPPFTSQKRSKKYWVNSEKACPYCETPWTITKFVNQVWYDCKPCNKTKEEIDKEG